MCSSDLIRLEGTAAREGTEETAGAEGVEGMGDKAVAGMGKGTAMAMATVAVTGIQRTEGVAAVAGKDFNSSQFEFQIVCEPTGRKCHLKFVRIASKCTITKNFQVNYIV